GRRDEVFMRIVPLGAGAPTSIEPPPSRRESRSDQYPVKVIPRARRGKRSAAERASCGGDLSGILESEPSWTRTRRGAGEPWMADPRQVGDWIAGRYEVFQVLQGGMSLVFVAHDHL